MKEFSYPKPPIDDVGVCYGLNLTSPKYKIAFKIGEIEGLVKLIEIDPKNGLAERLKKINVKCSEIMDLVKE